MIVSHLLSCQFSYVSQGPFGTLWWPLQANNFYTSLVLLWIDSERGLKGGVSQKHFKCLNFDLGSVAWGLECALMFVEALKSCRRFSTRIWNKGCRNIISNILNLIWGLLGEAWSACVFLSGCSCFGWLFNTFWNKECRKIVSKCLNLIWGVLSEAWSVHSFLLGLSSLIGEFWLGFETRSVVKWFRTFFNSILGVLGEALSAHSVSSGRLFFGCFLNEIWNQKCHKMISNICNSIWGVLGEDVSAYLCLSGRFLFHVLLNEI